MASEFSLNFSPLFAYFVDDHLAGSGERRPVLVTGATGCIGGRLVPRLLENRSAIRTEKPALQGFVALT
jgi:hypothetical protein